MCNWFNWMVCLLSFLPWAWGLYSATPQHPSPVEVRVERADERDVSLEAVDHLVDAELEVELAPEHSLVEIADRLEWIVICLMALLTVIEVGIVAVSFYVRKARKHDMQYCLVIMLIGAIALLAGSFLPWRWLCPVGKLVFSSGHGTKALSELRKQIRRLMRAMRYYRG